MTGKKINGIAGVLALAVAVSFMVSCKGDKPQPFLNPSRMCDLMCDIRLAEAHLYQTRETNTGEADRVMVERSLDVYVPIFRKYGLKSYEQFQALENYYMRHPEKLERILRKSAERLKEMNQKDV